MAALELTAVRKTYTSGDDEIVALDHATLEVGDDEILAMVGPVRLGQDDAAVDRRWAAHARARGRSSSAGRTSRPTRPSSSPPSGATAVGFVFQAVNLVPFLTARENLMIVNDFGSSRSHKEARARADKLLDELGLSHRVDNLPGQMSGGERQRVAIGRALMNEPALVLIDEPTSALDTKLGEQVMELIVSEVKSRNTAAVIVTHDQRMTHYADRTVTITDGVLAA